MANNISNFYILNLLLYTKKGMFAMISSILPQPRSLPASAFTNC